MIPALPPRVLISASVRSGLADRDTNQFQPLYRVPPPRQRRATNLRSGTGGNCKYVPADVRESECADCAMPPDIVRSDRRQLVSVNGTNQEPDRDSKATVDSCRLSPGDSNSFQDSAAGSTLPHDA